MGKPRIKIEEPAPATEQTPVPEGKPRRKRSVAEGLRFHALAEREHLRADDAEGRGDLVGARWYRKDAEIMEATAEAALATNSTDEIIDGNGGEIVSKELAWDADVPGIYDALTEAPDYLRAQAALDRLEHAPNGTITTAVEAANSIKAKDSLERMLCYQLASAHHTSQRLAKLAGTFAEEAERALNYGGGLVRAQACVLEATRCANAQARTAEAYQKGMLTLDRVRNGGKQHVTVQHVNVQDGGQAVVAGTVGRGNGQPGEKANER